MTYGKEWEIFSRRHEKPQSGVLQVKHFDVWGINFIGHFPSSDNNLYILMVVDYMSKCMEGITNPTNDLKVFIKLLKKNMFTRLTHEICLE